MLLKYVCLLVGLATCAADLRMASQPKKAWKTQQRNRDVPFRTKFNLYMEPSAFNYEGLEKQRDGGAYDNFLRSNIDNEQDRRNFNTEDGKDHLPFRSYETAANDNSPTVKHKMKAAASKVTGKTEAGNYMEVQPGVPNTVALRWNNPHSSELEVNIWIMKQKGGPYVIPVKRPSCSGEGYQDNVFSFTVPEDFNSVASCRSVGDCVLQVYAHSVESRMYASGTPLVVTGGTGAWKPGTIKEAHKDRALDLNMLRRLCLPENDPNGESNHVNAIVYKARLSSDVYNHAYQNSDFSPYAGQQPHLISQNLQAACVLKMSVGNFGELGKQYMAKTANEAREYAKRLDKKARGLVRVYETTTNSIIEAIKHEVKNNATLPSPPIPNVIVKCNEWRDQYDKHPGGRLRGKDRHGAYCSPGYTCLCHQDCYLGYGKGDASGDDAYCGLLEADGSMVAKKDADGKNIKDENGENVMVPSGKMQVKAGSEISRIGNSPQDTETCFRCAEVGSTKVKRQNTNTYIPSFEIHGEAQVSTALEYVAPMYLKSGFLTHPDTGAITQKGDSKAILQIYMAVLTEMWPEFKMASDGSYLEKYYKKKYDKLEDPVKDLAKFMFTYRGPVLKTTTATLKDATNFKKVDKDGKQDKGYYAASMAWKLQARGTGSSTAYPNNPGALFAKVQPSTNHADGVKSGGGNTVYKMPPPPAPDDSCAGILNPALVGIITEITREGKDMDGLNYDADCDSDEAVQAAQTVHDAACATEALKNPAYVCPPYPELECHIPGENAKLPGQMFTNLEEDGVLGAASTTVPSTVGLALVVALLGLF